MSTNIKLNLEKEELRQLTTRLYHESGYSLDHDDPIIVQYLIHKIAQEQFIDVQEKVMGTFANTLLTYIHESAERFEGKKGEFVTYAESKQEEMLKTMTDQYLKTVNGTLDKIGKAVSTNLSDILSSRRSEERELLEKLKNEHDEFAETANQFGKSLIYAALIFGAAIVAGAGILLRYY